MFLNQIEWNIDRRIHIIGGGKQIVFGYLVVGHWKNFTRKRPVLNSNSIPINFQFKSVLLISSQNMSIFAKLITFVKCPVEAHY